MELLRMTIEIVECQRVELAVQGVGLGLVLGGNEVVGASDQACVVGVDVVDANSCRRRGTMLSGTR